MLARVEEGELPHAEELAPPLLVGPGACKGARGVAECLLGVLGVRAGLVLRLLGLLEGPLGVVEERGPAPQRMRIV